MFGFDFENINIGSSNYVLIGLIILALVCIYLLYSNLTAGSEYITLKQNINDLVLQNKKRDEIIHFLVGQVQMLQSQPPITEITTHNQETDFKEHFVANDNENYINDNNDTLNVSDMQKLDSLLEEELDNVINKSSTITNTDLTTIIEQDDLGIDTNSVSDNNDDYQVDEHTETVVDESEDETNTNDIVANVISNSNLPAKDLDMLKIYTVQQLKEFAKQLNISQSGSKSALVKRVFEALE